MRWLFIFLVFLNLFFYIWQRQQTNEALTVHHYNTAPLDENIPTLKLLTEQPVETITTTTANLVSEEKTAPLDNASSAMLASPLTCLYLGGVTNKEQLAVLAEYLTKIDTTMEPTKVELKQSLTLHLYLTVDDKHQLAELLAKLHSAQINTLIINRGPLTNQLSLGNFVSQTDAVPLEEALQKLQLTPQAAQLTTATTSYWLKIPPLKQTLFTAELLHKLSQELPTMQQQLMLCNLTDH